MYQPKRVTLFAGHYGSGKTNIAVNFALKLRSGGRAVAVADLDIVNPYFRTKDSKKLLENAGIELIASEFANSNVDLPALPSETYGIILRHDRYAVLDIGGDDRGALALGRYTPSIIEENNYDMLFVANCYRPLTQNAGDALEVMREIEYAGGIPFTGIVNNSNLGRETTAEDIFASAEFIGRLQEQSGLPLVFTSAEKALLPELSERIDNVFPLTLSERYYDIG